jgi:hypothetical protein
MTLFRGTYRNKSVAELHLSLPWDKLLEQLYIYKQHEKIGVNEFPFLMCSLEEIAGFESPHKTIVEANQRGKYLRLTENMLDYLGNPQNVDLLGCGKVFEIWNPEYYAQYSELALMLSKFSNVTLYSKKSL